MLPDPDDRGDTATPKSAAYKICHLVFLSFISCIKYSLGKYNLLRDPDRGDTAMPKSAVYKRFPLLSFGIFLIGCIKYKSVNIFASVGV